MSPKPEPVAEFDRALEPVRDWAGSVTGLPVVHDWAGDDGKAAVLLLPLSIAVAPASGPPTPYRGSAELSLDLLVTTTGMPGLDGAAATCALALDAAANGEWLVDAAGPDTALWLAMGRPPAPALILRVPVRRALERKPAPLVQQPVRLTPAHMRSLNGRVVTEDGRPVPAARVSLADGNTSAPPADHRGRFRIAVAAIAGQPLNLTVTARGESFTLTVDAPAADVGELGDVKIPLPVTV